MDHFCIFTVGELLEDDCREEKEKIMQVVIDLQKAFDSVWRWVLYKVWVLRKN